MKIEIAIQCHNFQHRLCWMLSSLAQQEPNRQHPYEILVNIAHVAGNGRPTTEDIAKHFQRTELPIKLTTYSDATEFQFRGLTRNRQAAETQADWLVFADTDMVYPPKFFHILSEILYTKPWSDETRCMYSSRVSTKLRPTEALIKKHTYPEVIADAWGQAARLPGRLMPNVGAGYFHLMSVKALRTVHGGYYVDPNKNKDHSWVKRFQKAQSDKQFRHRVGWCEINLPYQIHLQHPRDSDVGYHLELQR